MAGFALDPADEPDDFFFGTAPEAYPFIVDPPPAEAGEVPAHSDSVLAAAGGLGGLVHVDPQRGHDSQPGTRDAPGQP